MNATERQAIERIWKQARPTDITVEAISTISGKDGLRKAINSVEATAAKHQKTGCDLLLIVVKR